MLTPSPSQPGQTVPNRIELKEHTYDFAQAPSDTNYDDRYTDLQVEPTSGYTAHSPIYRWDPTADPPGWKNLVEHTISNGPTRSGVILNFYYRPNPHAVYLYKGIDTAEPWKTYNTYYNVDVSGIVSGGLGLDNYTAKLEEDFPNFTVEGWYDDQVFTNKIFDGDGHIIRGAKYTVEESGVPKLRMDDGDLMLYANMVHNDVTVVFDADGGTMDGASTLTGNFYMKTLEQAIKEQGGPGKYRPEKQGYDFKGWYKTNDKRFSLTSELIADEIIDKDGKVTLKAKWESKTGGKANVTIIYQALEANGSYKDLGTKIEENVDVGNILTPVPPAIKTLTQDEAYKDYYPESSSLAIRYKVLPDPENEDVNKIYIRYRKADTWEYKVEYYYVYRGLSAYAWTETGLPATGGETTSVVIPGAASTDTTSVTGRFTIVRFTLSDALASQLTGYKLAYFTYNDGEKQETPFIMIENDPTKTVNVVKVFLEPDPDSIEVPDRVVTYDGNQHADEALDYTAANFPGVTVPAFASGAEAKVHYLYYDGTDSNGNPILLDPSKDPNAVKYAGTYGVRAYVTVKIGDNTVVIWQSEDEGNMPPLHLYIERRIVFLHSMYAAAKEGNAGSVNPPAVYTGGVLTGKHVYTTGDSALTANPAEQNIAALIAILKSKDGFNYTDDDFGFLDDDALSIHDEPADTAYEFSASAFRRMPGVSSNVFTFKPSAAKEEMYRQNYNFYYMYGTLEIED